MLDTFFRIRYNNIKIRKERELLKMKKIILWENVFGVAWFVWTIICLVHHIKLNGLYIELYQEICIYGLLGFGVYTGIKAIRTGKDTF